ncbi:antibiotic biosynthesis monooxygenase family protein [Sediminibacillus massiliensis]|uniref:antibiotic biosynthesis monooxygenase family protein n=1 Tax=Sediminibacillus massiliensis TaxID=1926277 RepID=UPI0009885A8F|nr:antibiotic biosynthesis monooxygenase [Sediminibacillus massiliensis]
MNVYMTHGTFDFLLKQKQKHTQEKIFLMQANDSTLAYQESEGKSVFEEPRKYESFVSDGSIQEKGFVVMNNIPVTDEGRPIFETQFKSRAGSMAEVEGFQALRVLRPLHGNKYIVFVQWDKEESYKKWKNSQSFQKAHSSGKAKERPPYHAGPSYTNEYHMVDPDA